MNPVTNEVIGAPDTPVNIAPGTSLGFLLTLSPTVSFPPLDLALDYDCENTFPAPALRGINTLLISASAVSVPDVIALAATVSNDGIVGIPGDDGTGVFAVASLNIGAGGTITVTADTGGVTLPVSMALCQTNRATAACLQRPGRRPGGRIHPRHRSRHGA